ncbi:MAG: type III-B CRISPR module RAMP protein Cmr1 [Balneolales bacterium]|nr:type III-B CRISPR module RAMP protein Cmr1 [Balneolales bacterium]
MSRLHKITFDCEVLTPMFLGGADQQAELRVPSIRGFLRFWWRAAFSDSSRASYKDLQAREAALFGGTVDKQGQSSVTIRLVSQEIQMADDLWLDNNLDRPGFEVQRKRQSGRNKGIGFLYYSKAPNRNKKFEFIKPASSFSIVMTSLSKDDIELAAKVFYLGSILGGLGSRSRRTAGAFEIRNIHGLSFSLSDLKSWFTTHLSALKQKDGQNLEVSNLMGATVYQSNESFGSWYDAVNDLGNQYEAFRFINRSKAYLTPVLGAPVMHNRNNPYVASYKENGQFKSRERRSSPIYMSVMKEGERFRWVVTYLSGKIFPDGHKIANTFFVNRNSDDRNSKEIDLTLLNPDQPFFSNFRELI